MRNLPVMFVLAASVSCRSIVPEVKSTDSSKLKVVTDNKYLLKLSKSQEIGEETKYYFETCYRGGSNCVDALQYVRNVKEGGTRIHFFKSALDHASKKAVLRDFSEMIKDPEKAAVLAGSSATGVAVAGSTTPGVFRMAPKEGVSKIKDKVYDMIHHPITSSNTLGDAKLAIKLQDKELSSLGFDLDIKALGSNTRDEIRSRITKKYAKKGHIFSNEFATFLQKDAALELDGKAFRGMDALAFEAKDFDLAKYIKRFMQSKAISLEKPFDIRKILDPDIAKDFLLYADLRNMFWNS